MSVAGRVVITLVGGFNPLENISQNGNLPQIGVKIKNIRNHHLEHHLITGFPEPTTLQLPVFSPRFWGEDRASFRWA